MKNLLLTTALALTLSAPAYAAGTHTGGHMEMMQIGMPGDTAKIGRTVTITMMETADGEMLFEPRDLMFAQGETVHFKITNAGEVDHEFVMDTPANNEKHRALMMTFPEMEHDDANAVSLAPGESGEITWTFANAGEFNFACLIPGHMEMGMHGPLNVTTQ